MTYIREADIAAKLQIHDSRHKQRSGHADSPQAPPLMQQQILKYPSMAKDFFIILQKTRVLKVLTHGSKSIYSYHSQELFVAENIEYKYK